MIERRCVSEGFGTCYRHELFAFNVSLFDAFMSGAVVLIVIGMVICLWNLAVLVPSLFIGVAGFFIGSLLIGLVIQKVKQGYSVSVTKKGEASGPVAG